MYDTKEVLKRYRIYLANPSFITFISKLLRNQFKRYVKVNIKLKILNFQVLLQISS